MNNTKILVTGSNGQIGVELVRKLIELYGNDQVIATDIKAPENSEINFEFLDILNFNAVDKFLDKHKVTHVYHLAALLSSKGEQNPSFTWQVNFNAYLNLLELARKYDIERIFFPSTIGVFGHTTPKIETPQNTSIIPNTVYGISKITGELWNEYYKNKYGLDIRSLRFPGVISYETIPKGGTTDFAVEMFFEAIDKGHYVSYLSEDSALPMLYMPDVIKATMDLMHADKGNLSTAMGYNISAFSVSPKSLYNAIQAHLSDFTIEYKPDSRQRIADSWPQSIDDLQAKSDWSWAPDFGIDEMVADMMKNVALKLK